MRNGYLRIAMLPSVCRILVLGVLITNLSCGLSAPPETGAKTHPDDLTEFLGQLKLKYATVLDRFPEHVDSLSTLDALVGEVSDHRGLSTDDAQLEIMYGFSDHPVGLHLVEVLSKPASTLNSEIDLDFLLRVRSKAVGTQISLLALDTILSELRKRDANQFMLMCQEIISGSTDARDHCIARLQLVESKYERGETKPAAIDYLRLWNDFPEQIERAGLPNVIVGCLHEAGFYLEADLMKLKEPANLVVAAICDLCAVDEMGEETGSFEEEISESTYYALAPDLIGLKALLASDAPATAFDRALLSARAGRIAIENFDGKNTLEFYRYFDSVLERLATEVNLDPSRLRILSAVSKATTKKLIEMYTDEWVYVRADTNSRTHQISTVEATDVAASIAMHGLSLYLRLAGDVPEDATSDFLRDVREYIDLLKNLKARRDVVEAYTMVANTYPGESIAAPLLMECADYYSQDSKLPEAASAVYRRVIENYPQSDYSDHAQVKLALYLYRQERYEESYLAMEEYLAVGRQDGLVPIATYISAMNESAMGLRDNAHQRMRNVVEDFPGTDVAPKALYWLGSESLSAQEYVQARELFIELKERYPDAIETRNARKYIERLNLLESRR